MRLNKLAECPWCSAQIEQRLEHGVYACPVCSCRFTRTPAKWKVGIPVAVAVAVLLWILAPHHGRLAACLAAISVVLFTAKTSTHKIASRGRPDFTIAEAKAHTAKWKEDRWFIVVIALLLAGVLILLVLDLTTKQ